MEDESAKNVPGEKREYLVTQIMKMLDKDENGTVEREEFLTFSKEGGTLPDFGLGPGHHWDMEMEYEIHHWEK
jgi:hypothetical protein